MRLFLFLAAVLVVTLRAQNTLGDVTLYSMPAGLPIGAILTFYIKHVGNDDYPESVWINFYDLPAVEIDKVYDVPAHLRIERDWYKPVYSNSFMNYEFRQENEVVREQPLDEELPSNGWWRVDVIRIRIKLPNSNVPPMSVEKFKTDMYSDRFVTGLSFYAFPVGSHMEFAAVLRSSGGAKYKTPALIFVNTDENGGPAPKGTPEFALKLSQHWDGYTQRTYIGDSRGQTECTQDKPNGDLQHIKIERVAKTIVTMRIFYKPSTGAKCVECRHTVPEDLAKYLDQHFQIESRDGALIFHLDHSVPRFLELQRDSRTAE
ncbi:hypothetical protein PRIPAC_88304 [Pristionchus pacificus]|uniref:Uncharacterized protein n=1 Tax=Pristionchus pacificus TaxID=54126 RepID=A0A454XZI8_PRIPA|nr:hypothetical protein PRIPAC_88304 [Pristionchus pacificus]|eukprot:PDM82958.1 hypothetical protein PRIPAC_37351 [Pristionchus pacificus]